MDPLLEQTEPHDFGDASAEADWKESMMKKGFQLFEQVKEGSSMVSEFVQHIAKEKPLLVVGGATFLGFLFGRLLSRKNR